LNRSATGALVALLQERHEGGFVPAGMKLGPRQQMANAQPSAALGRWSFAAAT
jgi:hypothetical protein